MSSKSSKSKTNLPTERVAQATADVPGGPCSSGCVSTGQWWPHKGFSVHGSPLGPLSSLGQGPCWHLWVLRCCLLNE